MTHMVYANTITKSISEYAKHVTLLCSCKLTPLTIKRGKNQIIKKKHYQCARGAYRRVFTRQT